MHRHVLPVAGGQGARRHHVGCAVDTLKSPDNASYTGYADLQRRPVVWNVVAPPALAPGGWIFATRRKLQAIYATNVAGANNASFAALAAYVDWVDAFETLFVSSSGD
ncbi:MAG: aminopeptidase [Burkholderiales bacterium]|nr:aminopeptidase [Burkholderiales bacterium]